ncbi:MAG: hypothetical protein RRY22_04250 [Bacilli bacterium]
MENNFKTKVINNVLVMEYNDNLGYGTLTYDSAKKTIVVLKFNTLEEITKYINKERKDFI